MDLNRLFNMLSRMFLRSAMRTGLDFAARRGKPQAEMTPEERVQAKNASAMAQKAQRAARIGRRFLK
ncbi:MAG: hypothetical protein ACK4P8_01325 [Tabrizicola sp.]